MALGPCSSLSASLLLKTPCFLDSVQCVALGFSLSCSSPAGSLFNNSLFVSLWWSRNLTEISWKATKCRVQKEHLSLSPQTLLIGGEGLWWSAASLARYLWGVPSSTRWVKDILKENSKSTFTNTFYNCLLIRKKSCPHWSLLQGKLSLSLRERERKAYTEDKELCWQ